MRLFIAGILLLSTNVLLSQIAIKGKVLVEGQGLSGVNIVVKDQGLGTVTNTNGAFELVVAKNFPVILKASYVGYKAAELKLSSLAEIKKIHTIELEAHDVLSEVVITGNLREMRKLDSPIPVEVYEKELLTKNPTPNLFEALERVNGVRPQINCNVCNTGDIHINGLEGPYTMILLDGMPIVSGLSTVYGLSGIPNGILDQLEIVKGPSSAIYGSEALAGVINVVTKMPSNQFYGEIESYVTSWGEVNTDLSLNTPINERVSLLTGFNHFNYQNPLDKNGDNFTDVTLQERYSLFNKVAIKRADNQRFNLASRVFKEERWGGEMQWTPEFSGGDSIYGEHIKTERFELVGVYDVPEVKGLSLQGSYNFHKQASFYGDVPYNATQQIGFTQLVYNKPLNSKTHLSTALAYRYTYYDDNTPATADEESTNINKPSISHIPGLFAQIERSLGERVKLLAGARLDDHENHGQIFTPRVALKYGLSEHAVIRLNAGTGFRVVNIFTEDHAALTGARKVIIEPNIQPERSKSLNLNYEQNLYSMGGSRYTVDLNTWYTHFSNQIIPDYDSNPNEIRYANLSQYAISQGVSVNASAQWPNKISAMLGVTYADVHFVENDIKTRPLLSENWSATWSISKEFKDFTLDYTGNLYGPMRLPLLGELDPRPEYSPWFSLQNINLTWRSPIKNLELGLGVKNLLDFTPARNSIARANDPFDRGVNFDENGEAIADANNPNALTFDPSYVYAPNQGRRYYFSVKYSIF